MLVLTDPGSREMCGSSLTQEVGKCVGLHGPREKEKKGVLMDPGSREKLRSSWTQGVGKSGGPH